MGDSTFFVALTSTSDRNGQGDEGNEGDEGHGSHEGHEGHEEEGGEQDRKGQNGQARRLSWIQGEDHKWFDQERLGEEQERKDCEQEEIGSWQEGVLQHQGLDFRSPEGKEGTWREGLRCYQEGL